MVREIQFFHVGIKAFITKGDQLLMVKGNHVDPHWELPGGRIDVGEELLPAENILRREITEELGPDVRIDVKKPLLTWSRQLANWDKYVYLIGFDCHYVSGDIKLSDEHTDYRWVNKTESLDLDLATGYKEALEKFWNNR